MASIRSGIALAVYAAIAAAAWLLSDGSAEGRALAFSLAIGAVFGIVLQRSRFCFLCHTRDFMERRDARGVVAILVALAVGTLGYVVVFGAWLPNPNAGRLAPDAHIGPVSIVLALAAFVFGIGMAVSGSCISGHLYRLGEGSPTAPFALLGSTLGFVAGFLTWNTLFIAAVAGSPVLWLPQLAGYGPWLVAQLAVIGTLAIAAIACHRSPEQQSASREPSSQLAAVANELFVRRWPFAVGGAAVGVLGATAYLRVGPLGVTAELGSVARTAASMSGVLPETLHGLDSFAGCRTALRTALLSNNGVFVAGLVSASFASAIMAAQFKPERPTLGHALRGIGGGVLLGWGAMTAIGCTVGTLLSGIMAGAVSGWIFLMACGAGIGVALPLTRTWLQG